LKIQDKDGKTLEEFQSNPQAVLDPQAAYELVSIMTDNDARSFIFGSNSPLILPGRLVAAKTGTTNNWHDGWTLGFTPSLAAGVWAGNNDGTLLKKGADGVVVAAPIWHDFMLAALAGTPAENFSVPSGIQKVVVDEVSGKLPTDATPNTKTEIFADYAVPTASDDVHIKIAVDSITGLPATNLTPPGQIAYKIYSILHSEKPDNPNWENPVVEWALAHGYSYPDQSAQTLNPPGPSPGQGLSVSILDPADGATLSELPFQVTVSAISSNPIARVDLSINGELYQSLASQPYVFSINRALSDGSYTLAAHAVDLTGQSADTSSSFTFAPASPLSLIEPANQSLLQFPVNLIAESDNLYNLVNFYYQDGAGQIKLIGSANNIDHTGKYHYSLVWKNKPPSGTYKLFAQATGGVGSRKITVTIP